MSETASDRKTIRQLMVSQHRGQKRVCGRPYRQHPDAVAKLGEAWGQRHFKQGRLIMPMDRATIENMWCAGMLHDTIVQGQITWDDIHKHTNLEVANYVAALSCDKRLGGPRRIAAYANQLYHTDMPVKIVALADLCCNLQDAIVLLQSGVDTAQVLLQGWPAAIEECIRAIDQVGRGQFNNEWKWCNRTVHCIGDILRSWSQRTVILSQIDACPGL